eukprot:UN27242
MMSMAIQPRKKVYGPASGPPGSTSTVDTNNNTNLQELQQPLADLLRSPFT